jgi:hypothetical protein
VSPDLFEYTGPHLGDTMTVFAWWPIAMHGLTNDGRHIEYKRLVWLKRVTLMYTLCGWTAYERHQVTAHSATVSK